MEIISSILLILLITIFVLLFLILLVPFTITIDSLHSIYELKFAKLAKANIKFTSEKILVFIHLLFLKKEMSFPWTSLIPAKNQSKKKRTVNQLSSDSKKKKNRDTKEIISKVQKVIKSFEIKKCWVNLDTENYTTNAVLFPAFYFLKAKNLRMNINYMGENQITFIVRNRLGKILFALFT